MAFITTAIMPPSDLTIPARAIWSTARQRLPALHPEPPMLWFTTGLRNGSRRPPAMLMVGCASFLESTGFFLSSTATAGFAGFGWLTATVVVFLGVTFGAIALEGAFDTGAAVCTCVVPGCLPAAGFAAAACGCAFCPCEAASAAFVAAVFCCCAETSLALVVSMMLGVCPPAVPNPIPS